MKRGACGALVLFVALANAQVTQWIHQYPGFGSSGAYDIALDNSGNVYVTGWGAFPDRSRDCLTMKYSSVGDTIWVRYYDGGANFYDDGYALALNDAGDVYVTGRSITSGSDYDIVTIKYNSAGVQQWAAVYAGADNGDDEGYDIEVDDSGYVYVTGSTYATGQSTDWITVKYDASGDTVWTARYNDPDSSSDVPTALALDGADNVYVTGYAIYPDQWFNITTIKYDAAGVEQWLASYNGPLAISDDKAYAVDCDNGYIYVTGESENADYDADYLTIKYDDSGDTVWTRRYDGPGGSDDEALAITVDDIGNVFVTGESFGVSSSNDYATIKYTSTGTQEWVSRYNGSDNLGDEANAITFDDLGNVYVTGRSYANAPYTPEFDYLTVKYDAAGNEQWAARYDGTGHTQDEAHAIAVDIDGYVYITGESIGTTSYEDVVTICYGEDAITEGTGSDIHNTGYNLTVSPNPFNHYTKIRYSILDTGYLMQNPSLAIFDASGRLVRCLKPVSSIGNQEFEVFWDGTDQSNRQLPSGVYFLRLESGDRQMTHRLLLIK
jgi:hypothetical protein